MSIHISNRAGLLSAICGGLLMGMSAIPQAIFAQQPTTQQPINSPNSKVNPCPKIFYEEPHNNRVTVPQGCTPNAYTQRLIEQGLLPQSNVPTTSTTEQTNLGVGGERNSALNPNPSILNEAPYNRSQRGGQTSTTETITQPSTSVPTEQTPAPGSTSQVTPTRQTPSATIALASGRVNIKLINDTGASVTYQVIGDTAPRSLQGKTDVTLQRLNTPVTVTFQREDGGLLQATPQPSSKSGVLEVRLKETTDVGQDRSALRIEGNGSVFLN